MKTIRRVKNDKPIDLDFHIKVPNVLRKKGIYTATIRVANPDGSIFQEKRQIKVVVYPPMIRNRK